MTEGKPVDGKLKLYFADGSTFAAPVITGRIAEAEAETIEDLLARQRIINDAHDKIVELSTTEYQRLDFGKLD